MSKKIEPLRDAIAETGVLVPFNVVQKGGWVDVLCKEIPGQAKSCLRMAKALLQHAEQVGLVASITMSKRFLLKNGELAFAWSIQLEAKTVKALEDLVQEVVPIIQQIGPDAAEPVAQTKAPPRAPVYSGPDPEQPDTAANRITVIRNDVDEDGKRVVISEMPIPHVYEDLNRPNEKGKGAFRSTEGGFHPRKTRNS